jgi:LuxR family maltose regulon positive regulatory protein
LERRDIPAASDKVRLPHVAADHLPRPRLEGRLGGAGCTPVTLVCAPSGFGKTSLVGHWALEADEPVAWLNLDASDGDVAIFAHHLVAAVRTVGPDAGEQTRRLLRKRSPVEPSEFGRSILADLDAVAAPFVLVLDDYSSLPPGAVHDVVEEVLRHQPPTMRLVLLARHDPPLAIQELLVGMTDFVEEDM